MALAPAHWRLWARFPAPSRALGLALLEALEEPAPFALLERAEGPDGDRIAALFLDPPDLDAIRTRMTIGLAEMPGAAEGMELALEEVAAEDWVRRAQEGLPPVRVGRVVLHGSHDRRSWPANLRPFEVEAGEAFGTGHHETTRLCLAALQAPGASPRRILDLGCGSGVLALAAARLFPARALATDNDPLATAVARENARKAGLGPHIRVLTAEGLAHPLIRAGAPYDLILANILARPLLRLAPGLAACLARAGRLVLSGLLTTQEREIRARYRAHGLIVTRADREGEWSALTLSRPRRPHPSAPDLAP
ncbi:MAG: 50S ribosomal protein L11 methyltransferase [Alphaproteobacteria bacterium]|nr:50S ribosomal protein L11 methyltransferase [Alphaproteobacteria bacterium]